MYNNVKKQYLNRKMCFLSAIDTQLKSSLQYESKNFKLDPNRNLTLSIAWFEQNQEREVCSFVEPLPWLSNKFVRQQLVRKCITFLTPGVN